ncbi:Hypothetical protein GSB_152354 [Giardia duodenalis]|uniref:Uncharacterized protein n=2 Tax=Giardia intestinalis TaxID=5741 RepID=C6LN36_GIAIB|nr:Hypothetical protein GL50581_136 [Giardia intestinalis ATCC 50581]ESU44081.1 Hypothetical protein GSB_152354 [Giardia intestinalis]
MEEWLLTLTVTLSIVLSSLISATIYYTTRCIRARNARRSQPSLRSQSSQSELERNSSEVSGNIN